MSNPWTIIGGVVAVLGLQLGIVWNVISTYERITVVETQLQRLVANDSSYGDIQTRLSIMEYRIENNTRLCTEAAKNGSTSR